MAEAGRTAETSSKDLITVQGLVVGYGETIVLEEVSFAVGPGEILTILGPSGCGKSTLLKALAGLASPFKGRIRIAGEDITAADNEEALTRARRHLGVLFQSGALFESITVAQNVALPLREFTNLPPELIEVVVQLKLDLVGLGRHGHLMPGELSGGMKKRAGLARTMALDPQILLCDEPSGGLDPVRAREVDELLVELSIFLGITLVVVTHQVATIENLSGRCLMLDPESKGIIAAGTLEELKDSAIPRVRSFFQRQLVRRPRRKGS
jgi:phospholipid/cholesterol/gamma-HCH transport system ATP-binding protein